MNIAFECQGGELILTLASENFDAHEILEVINKGREWRISHSFVVHKKHFRFENAEQNEIQFCAGTIYDEYALIDSDI